MTKRYPLHHEDARPMYVQIHVEEYDKLNKRIAELENENESLKYSVATLDKNLAMLKRWRKFPEEKPIWGKEVLVVDDERKQYIVRFSHDMKWISWGKMNTCESNCVKFWMPLPEPPEMENVYTLQSSFS